MTYVWFLGGIFVGSIITQILLHFICGEGTLRIDHTNPEKDQYLFMVDDLDKINRKRKVILRVDHVTYHSPK